MKMKVVVFESFAYVCPYFTSEYDVNNGYGCKHTSQEEMEEDESGVDRGKCYCWSCPLGVEPNQESLENPNVVWSNVPKEDCVDKNGKVLQGEFLLINNGSDASEDEIKTLQNYEQYINRYNQK